MMKKDLCYSKRAAAVRMIDNPSVWRQWPNLLIYPLQGYALLLIIIFSLMLWIGLQTPLGLPAFFIILSWSLKYAYGVLEYTLLGHATPPMFTFDLWNPTQQRPLKQLFYLLFFFSVAHGIEKIVGSVPASIVFILGIFFMPASAIIIVSQNSLLHAFNPLKLVMLVVSIGSAYLFISLLFILMTLLSLPIILSYIPLLSLLIPDFLGWTVTGIVLPLLFFGILYLLILTFHLLGFVAYHRRQRLGLEVFFSPEQEMALEQQEREKQLNQILDEVYWLARQQGKMSVAIDTLFARLSELGDTLDVHEKLFARISLWEDNRVALAQGQYYIHLLIKNKQLSQALSIYKTGLKWSVEFKLKSAYHILPLANQAYYEKDYAIAWHLVQDSTIHFPHPDILALQFLKAKLLTEHFDRFDEAKAIISQLIENKSHQLYPEIRKYAIFLAKLIQLRKI